MYDLALDNLNNDLSIVGGGFVSVVSAQEVAQRVRTHLQRWFGEWFLNITLGVPYAEKLLGQKDKTLIELYLRKEIATIDGVEKIKTFNIVQDYAARAITAYIELTTTYGEDVAIPIEVTQ
ncbi:MAG TPA: hypothetical protein DDW84_00140 [Phycisphaerales bacterium]|nr:MAG: hypothetical protein A2Y13_02015 [Planctomycetes bacterium GWC2_45_44]HBG77246.1 hypothetical protein [Phycisphaerales bacterium]HBR19197.1 hypothetical protein [Phycisphaerales bacterium]